MSAKNTSVTSAPATSASVTSLGLLVLTIFTVVAGGCVSSGGTTGTAGSSGVTFLHLNDTYRIDAVEEGRRGGFGRVATLIRALKAEGKEVMLLHGGDFLYPSLESQLWAGAQIVEALNFLDALAPMVVVPGNHEFDPRAAAPLIDNIRASNFEWLADNIRLDTGDEAVNRRLRSAYSFSAGGMRIGIFAITVHPDHGGNTRDYTPFSGRYLDNAERVIRQFEAEGVDVILGLTHVHLANDIELAKLKRKHPRFQFIVGGHEHEPEYRAGDADNAAIMKGASNARTIWQIDLQMVDGDVQMTSQQIAVDESIELDPDYQVIADKWRTQLLELIPFLPSRIGSAAIPLDGREVTVRNRDSNWGMFIADQMRTAFRDPPADLALVNGGTLRLDDFVAEDITFEDIGRTFGFSSFLRYMTIDGGDFRRALEAGYRGFGPSKGYFPQISGFRVCVDRNRPDGQRIVQLQVPNDADGWQEIDADRAYTAVVPDFLYRGGDGYDFSAARDVSRPGSELKYLVLDAVVRAQAAGEKIGQETDLSELRFDLLAEGSERCFN